MNLWEKKIRKLFEDDDSYHILSYKFIAKSLDFTLKRLNRDYHFSGKELMEGVREYAISQFGCMVRPVFSGWGINKTSDWGEIVYNMMEKGLLSKQSNDRIEDFEEIYDFDVVFNVLPVFPTDCDWKKTKYIQIDKYREEIEG